MWTKSYTILTTYPSRVDNCGRFTCYLYFILMTKHGFSTYHRPTSSCPPIYRMAPSLLCDRPAAILTHWVQWPKEPLYKSYSGHQSHYREVPRWEIFMEQELRVGLVSSTEKKGPGQLWATFEGGFFMFSGAKKNCFVFKYCSFCTKKLRKMERKKNVYFFFSNLLCNFLE